jgi:hypothetical protein
VKPSCLYAELIEVEERAMFDLDGDVESERVVKGAFGELVKVVKPSYKESLKPLLENKHMEPSYGVYSFLHPPNPRIGCISPRKGARV